MGVPLLKYGVKSLSLEEGKPPELYLISHDIQEGDPVDNMYDPTPGAVCTKVFTDEDRFLENDGIIDWTDPGFSSNPDDQHFSSYAKFKNWYKVVGKLSPEATWVKEGDRFDKCEEWWFAALSIDDQVTVGALFPVETLKTWSDDLELLFPNAWKAFRVQCTVCSRFH